MTCHSTRGILLSSNSMECGMRKIVDILQAMADSGQERRCVPSSRLLRWGH